METGYLCELVVPYAPRIVLKSAESNLLTVTNGKYGSRSFVRASVNLWNSLRQEFPTGGSRSLGRGSRSLSRSSLE